MPLAMIAIKAAQHSRIVVVRCWTTLLGGVMHGWHGIGRRNVSRQVVKSGSPPTNWRCCLAHSLGHRLLMEAETDGRKQT